jgi:hypothetical protein
MCIYVIGDPRSCGTVRWSPFDDLSPDRSLDSANHTGGVAERIPSPHEAYAVNLDP